MTIAPESIRVGKCYVTRNDQVVRVTGLLPDGYVLYAFRSGAVAGALGWTRAQTAVQVFVHLAEREVPCDRAPAGEGQERHSPP